MVRQLGSVAQRCGCGRSTFKKCDTCDQVYCVHCLITTALAGSSKIFYWECPPCTVEREEFEKELAPVLVRRGTIISEEGRR